jgi:molecular chaperone GrpE
MIKSDKKENEEIVAEAEKESPVKQDDPNSKTEPETETIEDKLNHAEEKVLRLLAEMENQRRRFEKERQEAFEFGGYNFAKESLVLLDNIDRATVSFKNDESLKNNKDIDKIIDGIEIIKKDLISIFKKNGIEPIDCINKKFDPNFHQAMLEVSNSEKENGIIVQEIQIGYMMKNRLLRPSLVGVAKRTDKESNNEEK